MSSYLSSSGQGWKARSGWLKLLIVVAMKQRPWSSWALYIHIPFKYIRQTFFWSAYCPVLYPDPHSGTIYPRSEISFSGFDHADWVTLLPKVLHSTKISIITPWIHLIKLLHPAYLIYDTGNWAFSCYCYHQHSLLVLFRELCYETLYRMLSTLSNPIHYFPVYLQYNYLQLGGILATLS